MIDLREHRQVAGTNQGVHGVGVRVALGAEGWRGRLALVTLTAVTATAALTIEILVAHHLNGRGTSLGAALAWSVAAIGTWAIVAVPGLAIVESLAAHRSDAGWRRPATVALIAGLSLLLVAGAVTLRALVDPVLPDAARNGGSFAANWLRYAVRWSGPGALATATILLAGWVRVVRRRALRPVPTPAEPPLDRLVVRIGTRSVTVAVDGARWFEASGNYTVVHGPHGQTHARITMATLEARLDPARFVRVHRSAIVALAEVREVRAPRDGPATLRLSDGSIVPLSRVGRREIERRLGQRA
jgi:LytTr DNA-binding domain-containing protein